MQTTSQPGMKVARTKTKMKRSRVAHQVALKQIKLWALPDRKAESAPAESSSWSVMVSCGRDRDRACNRSRSKSADETGRTKEAM